MLGGEARGERVQDAHIPGEDRDDDDDDYLPSPLNADGNQGEGAGVHGGGLRQGDDVAADLTKRKVTQGQHDYLK